MNENINLVKILKDCPEGFELYSTVLGEVKFVQCIGLHRIIVKKEDEYYHFTQEGVFIFQGTLFEGECVLLPSKDQRDWSKFNAPWYKKKRFDPKTLKEFDRILGWNPGTCKWECNLFSNINDYAEFNFKCFGVSYKYCIPYNDDTKHIVGTKEEAPEYYRFWED